MSDDPDPTRVERVTDQTTVLPDQGGGEPPYEETVIYDDPPPPPDRRPWILAAILAAIVLVLLLVLLMQDDDDDGDDVSSESTTTEQTTTSSSSTTAPSSTTSQGTTTTVAPIVTVPPAECAEAGEGAQKPGLAAGTVFDAWVRGDKACADELMTDAALAELFSRDGTGATDELQGCSEEDIPDPHVDCTFTYEGGATHYLMNFSDTDGWQVYDIEQVAD